MVALSRFYDPSINPRWSCVHYSVHYSVHCMRHTHFALISLINHSRGEKPSRFARHPSLDGRSVTNRRAIRAGRITTFGISRRFWRHRLTNLSGPVGENYGPGRYPICTTPETSINFPYLFSVDESAIDAWCDTKLWRLLRAVWSVPFLFFCCSVNDHTISEALQCEGL